MPPDPTSKTVPLPMPPRLTGPMLWPLVIIAGAVLLAMLLAAQRADADAGADRALAQGSVQR